MTPEQGRSIGHEIRQIIATEKDKDHDGTPPAWLNVARAREITDEQRNPFPDEADLLTCAELMLRIKNRFLRGFGTREANDLEVRYGAIISNPAQHLSAVLWRQRNEVTQFLRRISDPQKDPDKRFRNLQRGISKREEVIIRKLDLLDTIEDRQLLFMVSSLLAGRRHRDLPQGRNGLIAEIIRLNEEIMRMAEETELQLELSRKKNAAQQALLRIDQQLTLLRETAKMEEGEPKTDQQSTTKPQQQGSKQQQKRRQTNRPDQEPTHKKPEPAKSDTNGTMETDIQRLTALIQGLSRVRVIVPPEGNNRKRKQCEWEALLRKIGYCGEVIFVAYEEVRKRDGSPIIVGRNINTHKDLWAHNVGDAPLHVITFTPKILTNYLNISEGR